MPADRDKLRATLAELHAALENAQLENAQSENVDALDPDVADQLRATLAELQSVLDRQGKREPSLAGRLADAARHFEESHPTLSATLGNVIDALGRMGI